MLEWTLKWEREKCVHNVDMLPSGKLQSWPIFRCDMSFSAMKRAARQIPKQLRQWENYGQPKIALKVKYLETQLVSRQTKLY